jgi:unsaturated rhamnogalacturonyl hydrolase
MKFLYFAGFSLLTFLGLPVGADCQNSTSVNDNVLLRSIADNLLSQSAFEFEGVYNTITYPNAKEIPDSVTVKFKSKRAAWHYANGVLNIAMLNLGKFLNEPKYTDNALHFISFSFDNLPPFEKRYNAKDPKSQSNPFRKLIDIKELDDCGAIGASIIEAYQKEGRSDYKNFIERTAKHITEIQDRLPDGTLVRKNPIPVTLWADDLYMSVPFLVRMGKFSNEKKYYEDAIRQVFNFNKYLWDPFRELYYHCWFSTNKQNGVAHWGRCNGWIMMAQVHLLNILPDDYPKRDSLTRNLERQIIGISRYQNIKGLWYQLIDKPDSYEESSSSAMYIYSIAKAINENWIDKKYASIALAGWDGLKTYMITPEGNLKSVCVGTGIQNDLVFYYKRPIITDDLHGLGAIIEAGIEIIKLKQKLGLK